jgi:uncharacterized protein YggE
MRQKTLGAALILLGAAAIFALTGCTSAPSGGSAPDTVTALGTGTGSATPDTAEISLGVTSVAKDRLTAQNSASKTAAGIIDAVKAAGIDAKDIQTGQISLNEQYGSTGSTIVGYQAMQSIDVKTKSLDKVSAAISAATNAGATNVSGPTFTLSDANAARIDAIGKAMADAKARAEAMAKAAGRTLGRVISVTEAPSNQVGPVFDTAASAGAVKSVPVPVQPGQVDTQTQLTVVFALQ